MNIVVFSGAGLSVESNIPTFEDREGIFSQYDKNFTFGNVLSIYNKYNNFHGVHQTLAESKAGLFNAYDVTDHKATAIKATAKAEDCTNFKKAFTQSFSW